MPPVPNRLPTLSSFLKRSSRPGGRPGSPKTQGSPVWAGRTVDGKNPA